MHEASRGIVPSDQMETWRKQARDMSQKTLPLEGAMEDAAATTKLLALQDRKGRIYREWQTLYAKQKLLQLGIQVNPPLSPVDPSECTYELSTPVEGCGHSSVCCDWLLGRVSGVM